MRAAALLFAIIATWCVIHHRLNAKSWRVPLYGASDALTILAAEKAVAEGDFPLFGLKFNRHLGAPHVANWNDWPTTEDSIIVVAGLLGKRLGVFAAANLMVLLGHCLAGLAFYLVCRRLRYRWQWAFAGALTFALSHYAFQRGLPHLVLTYYWHIPLCLLVVWVCGSRRGLPLRGTRFWLALLLGIATGIQNPYYTNVFLQFLGLTALAQLLRRAHWKRIVAPVLVGTAAMAGFVLMNLDTMYYGMVHGKNPEVAYRSYRNLEIYALKPLDLLIPPPTHRAPAARAIAWRYLYDEAAKTSLPGEAFYPYLGLAGIASLAVLLLSSIGRVAAFPRMPLPIHALQIVWLVLYSVVGGINGLLGQLGVKVFRCTDRFSIYILAIALLFAVKALTLATRRWNPLAVTVVAGACLPIVLWDQLPPLETESSIGRIESRVDADRAFTTAMQKALRRDAMVFQLPVMHFPESWPIFHMGDYEHLRPYLYSSELHYSYGSAKGRSEDDWQIEAERQHPGEMVRTLEQAGFSAIYINRKGYKDNGAELLAGLQAAGLNQIIESPAHDLVCVVLKPSANPTLPETPAQFTSGWYGEEGDAKVETWRCSSGDAEVLLHNDSREERAVQISFQLASHSPRTVQLSVDGNQIYESPTLSPEKLSYFTQLVLRPGETRLSFKTEPPVTFPGNPDTRLLGFVLYNFRALKEPSEAK